MIIFTIIDILKDRTGVYILFKTIQYGITSELSGATITRYGPKYTDTYWSVYMRGQYMRAGVWKYTILSLCSSIWKLDRWGWVGCMKNVCSREACDSLRVSLINALDITTLHYTKHSSASVHWAFSHHYQGWVNDEGMFVLHQNSGIGKSIPSALEVWWTSAHCCTMQAARH